MAATLLSSMETGLTDEETSMKTWILALVAVAFNAQAAGHRFESISSSGSGCPSGASITFSPDNKAASIIFDEFSAQVPNAEGNLFERKNCVLKVTATLPAGFSLEGLNVSADYRGFVAVEPGAEAGLSIYSTPIFARPVAPIASTLPLNRNTTYARSLASLPATTLANLFNFTTKRWVPKDYVSINDEWAQTFKRFVKAPLACSLRPQTVSFNLYSSVYAKVNDANDPNAFAMVSVDSSDISAGLKLTLASKPCLIIKRPIAEIRNAIPIPGPIRARATIK